MNSTNNSWLLHTTKVFIHNQLKEQLLAKGKDSLHPDCWTPCVEFSVINNMEKESVPLPRLKAEAETVIAPITPLVSRTSLQMDQ